MTVTVIYTFRMALAAQPGCTDEVKIFLDGKQSTLVFCKASHKSGHLI